MVGARAEGPGRCRRSTAAERAAARRRRGAPLAAGPPMRIERRTARRPRAAARIGAAACGPRAGVAAERRADRRRGRRCRWRPSSSCSQDREDCLRAALAGRGRAAARDRRRRRRAGEPEALRGTLRAAALPPRRATRCRPARSPCWRRARASAAGATGAQLERELGRGARRRASGAAGAGGQGARRGALALIRCRLVDRRIRRLPAAADHLALLVLAPALGADAAAAALLGGRDA